MSDLLYLDNHATTLCDPRVVEAMLPYFSTWYGNPASTLHQAGQQAKVAVDRARLQVAVLLSADPHEIIFTSGATESNNLAILGTALQYGTKRRRIVTTLIEHKAVLEACRWLGTQGYEVVYIDLQPDGRIDLDHAANLINEETLLVSVQAANNEIGTIQPLMELGVMARKVGALFHTDAAQAVGKVPVDVQEYDVDFLSLSAHKLYGPKGVGALYVRGGLSTTPLHPLMWGGGQEQGLRPGTLNVPGIVGIGEAARLCFEELDQEHTRLAALRDQFEATLAEGLGDTVQFNGARLFRLPHNSSITFKGIDAETLLINVPNLALSLGSACTSGALEPSYVLTAIGLSREEAYQTLRVGLGRFTSESNIYNGAVQIVDCYVELSQLSKVVIKA